MNFDLEYSAYSIKGIRPNNQDSYIVENIEESSCDLESFLAIADGMGGMAGGHIASNIAIRTLKEFIYNDINSGSKLINGDVNTFIEEVYLKINKAILEEAENSPDYEGMGTTLTCAFIYSHTEIYIANVGDSRAYLTYEDEIIQKTVDHDVITDAKLKGITADSKINLDLYANALTRSMGTEDYKDVDIFGPFALNIGEGIILSSDGFHKFIQENQILQILNAQVSSKSLAENLVEKAFQNGSDDNITVITTICFDPSVKKVSPIEKSKKFKSKIGISLFPLVILAIYISYLTYQEFNHSNTQGFGALSDSISALGVPKLTNSENEFSDTSRTDFIGINDTNNYKSLRLICSEQSIPFPMIPNFKINVNLDSNYIVLSSYGNQLAKRPVQVSITSNIDKNLLNQLKGKSSSKLEIINCNSLDSLKIDTTCNFIKSDIIYSENENNTLSIAISDSLNKFGPDINFIILTKPRDFKELLEIVNSEKEVNILINDGKK